MFLLCSMLWVMSCVCVDVALSGVQYCYAVLPQEAALRVTSVHLSVWLFVPWPPLARKRSHTTFTLNGCLQRHNSSRRRVELCRYRWVSIATQLNSTDPVEQRTAKSVVFLFMTSRPTNWVNWVTTFIDRWQLFTLWTCRQLDVELSWVVSL